MSHAPLALTIPLVIALLLPALPSAVTARRARDGTLDRRGRLGLHTPAAMASERAFAVANRVAAPLVGSAAAVGVLCAVLVLTLPIGVAGAIVVAALGLIGLFGQLHVASTMGERAAVTVPRPARKPEPDAGCCSACGCRDEASGGEASCGGCGDGSSGDGTWVDCGSGDGPGDCGSDGASSGRSDDGRLGAAFPAGASSVAESDSVRPVADTGRP